MNNKIRGFSYRFYPGLLFFVYLFLTVSGTSASADLPLCNSVFTNGVQTHGETGNFVEFGFNARITNPSSDQLNVPVVEYNPWSTLQSCGSTHCSAGGDAVPKLWIDNFLNTGSSVKYLVPPNTGMIVGEEVTNIGEIDIREHATAEFSKQQNLFVIDRLFVGYKATLRLPEGSYWVRDFRMQEESHIEVIGDGSVNLYVQNSLDIPYKARINTNTKDPSKLTIYDESSSHFHVESTTYAFIITDNEFILAHGARIHGGLVGQYIHLESKSEVIFDSQAAQTISVAGLCRSSTTTPVDPLAHLSITGYSSINDNILTVEGSLISSDGTLIPITSITAKTSQVDLMANITGVSSFQFTLEQSLLDNYVTVTVKDINNREYSNEFNFPYYPSAYFVNINPPNGSLVSRKKILITGQVETPWTLASLKFELNNIAYPLFEITEGVYGFEVKKKLQRGTQTLTYRIHYPNGSRSTEHEITFDRKAR